MQRTLEKITMSKLVFAAAVIINASSICQACINDNELPQHEREFRSQYLDSRLTDSSAPQSHDHTRNVAMTWIGAGLLAVGFVFAWRRKSATTSTDAA